MVFQKLKKLFSSSEDVNPGTPPEKIAKAQRESTVTDARCPSTRKKRCPSCGNPVYVRTRPSDRRRVLATTEQAEAIEREWMAQPRREADADWAELNRKLLEAVKRSDWQEMSELYFEQALQLFEEGKPHLHVAQEARKAELRRYQGSGVVARVQILTARNQSRNQSCPSCQTLDGRQLTVEEALAQMPIPNSACTTWKDEGHPHGWCRCVYGPVVK